MYNLIYLSKYSKGRPNEAGDLLSEDVPAAVLAHLCEDVVGDLVALSVGGEVVLVERSVEAGGEYGSLRRRDGGLLAAAVEGADAGDLLRHREGRQRPLRPRVGAGHADRRQGRTPVQPA